MRDGIDRLQHMILLFASLAARQTGQPAEIATKRAATKLFHRQGLEGGGIELGHEAMVVAVAHRQFRNMGEEKLAGKITGGGCFVDVKSQFDSKALAAAGLCVWRL